MAQANKKENPNFALKSSVGRVKQKKDQKYKNEGLHIVDLPSRKNERFGINAIVNNSLDEYQAELEADAKEYSDMYDDIFGDDYYDYEDHDFGY